MRMRILIPAVAAASFLMLSLPSYSADEVKAGGPSDKPGRAIDDGSVKAGGPSDKPGRALDDSAVKSGGVKHNKSSRAVDDGTVKSGGDMAKPGRAADDSKKATKKKKKAVKQPTETK